MLTATSQFISLHVAFDDLREQKRRASRHDGTWLDSLRGQAHVARLNAVIDQLDARFAAGERTISRVAFAKMIATAKKSARLDATIRHLRIRVATMRAAIEAAK